MSERHSELAELCGHEPDGMANSSFMDRALSLLPTIVYVFNQDTQSNEYTNRSVGELMGYSPAEVQAFGSNLMTMLCHPDDLPNVFQHFKAISRLADDDVISIEYRIRHKEGHWVWFLSMDAVFERAEDGRVRRHIGVATDITTQKEAETRAVEASQDAAIANEDLRTFAYSISHDMKSPANTLHMVLSELEKAHGASLDEDALNLINLAQQTVTSMQARVERVLDYTRMIERSAHFFTVDLNDLLQGVISDMAGDISEAEATLDIGSLPMVSGKPEELKVLFQNLIGNALKFRTPETAPQIQIFGSSGEDGEVQVTVSDNGIGIPQASRTHVFEMFKRLHSDTTYPGTGLGLAICRRIANSHGGEISVKSREGEGATFTLQLRGAKPVDGLRRV